MIKTILISPRSATFELVNDYVYYNDKPYQVRVNKKEVATFKTNVFSLYGLLPDTNYHVEANGLEIHFTTKKESMLLDLREFGILSDFIEITNFLQAAINMAPKDATIYVPTGTYYLAPIFLKSDITLYLEKDCLLLGVTDRKRYPIIPCYLDKEERVPISSFEGNIDTTFAALITAINCQNVMVVGEGIIDEQAHLSDWWVNHKIKQTAWRPKGVFLSQCKNIALQGITVTNTPSWNIHPFFSEDLVFTDLKLISPKDSPNTDGLNPDCSKNIMIIGVYFSVGDDCIAIKSGKIELAMKYQTPTQNMTIRNCYMRDGHGAIVLGSEMSGGIKNLHISKCLFEETDRGLRVKTRRGRGKYGVIDGITFDNIIMNDVITPFVINMFYFCDPDGHSDYVQNRNAQIVDDSTPYLGKFHFKNIVASNVHAAAGFFFGLPEQKIAGITLENIKIGYSKHPTSFYPAMMDGIDKMTLHGFEFHNVQKVIIKNVTVEKTAHDSFIFDNVDTFWQ